MTVFSKNVKGALLSMASLLVLCGSPESYVRAFKISKCESRVSHMDLLDSEQEDVDKYLEIAGIRCETDADLFLQPHSKINEVTDIPTGTRWKSHATVNETKTIFAAYNAHTTIPASSDPNWAQFGNPADILDWNKPFMDGHSAFPKHVLTWQQNVRLECEPGGGAAPIRLKARVAPAGPDMTGIADLPGVGAPTNFVWMAPPKKDGVMDVMQAFGAYIFGEPNVPRSFTLGIVVGGRDNQVITGQAFTKAVFNKCVADGKLKVLAEPDATWAAASHAGAGPWLRFVDSAGNGFDQSQAVYSGGVVVTDEVLTCDFVKFKEDIFDGKIATLETLLEGATSKEQFEGAQMTYSAITNDYRFMGCKQLMDALYSTAATDVALTGVKACLDVTNTNDACCHQDKAWSTCCKPFDHNFSIQLFAASDASAISTKYDDMSCGFPLGKTEGVKYFQFLVEDVLGPGLVEQNHPDTSCDRKAKETIKPSDWMKKVESPVNKCRERVLHGRTRTGQENCKRNDECYSGTCNEGNTSHGRCQEVVGEPAAGPMLECLIEEADENVLMLAADHLDIPPDHVKRKSAFVGRTDITRVSRTSSEWAATVDKFKTGVGRPNCSGSWMGQARLGWCVAGNVVSQTDCDALGSLGGHDYAARRRAMKWVPNSAYDANDANSKVGWCRIKNYQEREDTVNQKMFDDGKTAQQACKEILEDLGGGCKLTGNPTNTYANSADCASNSGTWISYSAPTHVTLSGRTYHARDADTGNYEMVTTNGNQAMCEMEKVCNWDLEGRKGALSATQSACESPTHPWAVKSGSDDYFCARCHGPHCHDMWMSHPALCQVGGWRNAFSGDCAANSGGGPGNLAAVTAGSYDNIDKRDRHLKCHRTGTDFDTQAECLHADVCPNLRDLTDGTHHDGDDSCFDPQCYDTSKTESDCGSGNSGYYWKPEWKRGAGLCVAGWDSAHRQSKSACETAGKAWWEGRRFVPAGFNTADTCNTICELEGQAPTATCPSDSGQCDARCKKCHTHGTRTVCLHKTFVTADTCGTGYQWDDESKVCYLQTPGTKASCEANTAHAFFQCLDFAQERCGAYCEATDKTTPAACTGNDAQYRWEWDGALKREVCQNRDISLASDCTGANKQWREGGTNTADETRAKIHMGCFWHDHAPCSTQAECAAAGECEDWELGDKGQCVVPAGKNQHEGTMGECSEMTSTVSGIIYGWGPGRGTQCTVYKNGSPISKTDCEATLGANDAVSGIAALGVWKQRATTQTECEAHGTVCADPFFDWKKYGGFANAAACTDCGNDWEFTNTWRGASWQSPAVPSTLTWKKREYTKLNEWETKSLDMTKVEELLSVGVAKLQAAAEVSRVDCLLAPLVETVKELGNACGKFGAVDMDSINLVLDVGLGTRRVPASETSRMAPENWGEVGIAFSTETTCTADATGMCPTVSVSKSGVPRANVTEADSGARALTVAGADASADCSAHEVVVDSHGQKYGQKLGPGSKVDGVSGVKLCIKETVPLNEKCTSKYTVKDFVTVSDKGVYSQHLQVNVTTNAAGYTCMPKALAGVRYVPVLRTVAMPDPPAGAAKPIMVKAEMTFTMDLPAGATSASLMNDTDFTGAIRDGLASTLSFAGTTLRRADITLDEITVPTSRRTLKALEADNIKSIGASSFRGGEMIPRGLQVGKSVIEKTLGLTGEKRRRLASKALTIKYTVQLPSNTAAADVTAMKGKVSAGGSGNAAFLTSLKDAVTQNIKAAGIDNKYTVQSAASLGTAVSEQAAPDALPSSGAYSSILNQGSLSSFLVPLLATVGVAFSGAMLV